MNDPVPFVDLAGVHKALESELIDVLREALKTSGFIGGDMVRGFEQGFADFCGTRHCIGVSSGTDALLFALLASGVKPGDVVITVPNTFIATAEAIIQAGAIPDFVDVDEKTCLMNVHKLEEYIATRCEYDAKKHMLIHRGSSRPVSAIIPVHLYGLTADMDPICELADINGLVVIEDACQAHGARYFSKSSGQWKTAGSMGHAAAFSFYPGKNLGACGDAGAVTTGSDEIARRVGMLRDHGQAEKYIHQIQGFNGRLDAIQAGFLSVKLKYLDQWTADRRLAASWYKDQLSCIQGLELPFEPMDRIGVYHLYVVRTADRDKLKSLLESQGISTGLHYPIPLHKQSCLAPYGFSFAVYPVSERLSREVLSLPMYPGFRRDQAETVCRLIRTFFDDREKQAGKDKASAMV